MFAADSSTTEVSCTSYPDLSSGSGTVVQCGADSGTISACEPTTLGYNYKTTSTVVHSAVAGSTTEAELRFTTTANTFSDISTETATSYMQRCDIHLG